MIKDAEYINFKACCQTGECVIFPMQLKLSRKAGLDETQDHPADHRRPGAQAAASERLQSGDRRVKTQAAGICLVAYATQAV